MVPFLQVVFSAPVALARNLQGACASVYEKQRSSTVWPPQELNMESEQDPQVKSIVFSQFCAMLDLIEFRLKREGIHCAQLTGSMTAVAR